MAVSLMKLADRKEIAKKIFADRLIALHEHLLVVSVPATLLCATAVFFALYALEGHTLLRGWYAAILLVSGLRIGFMKWYERDQGHLRLHLKLFTVGTVLSGMLWGLAGSVLAPPPRAVTARFYHPDYCGFKCRRLSNLKSQPHSQLPFHAHLGAAVGGVDAFAKSRALHLFKCGDFGLSSFHVELGQ